MFCLFFFKGLFLEIFSNLESKQGVSEAYVGFG